MKKEATKKNKLWIVIVAAAVVLLAVAGVVLGFVLGGDKTQAPQGPTEGRPELYWNIDRVAFTEDSETGLSTREPGEDGMYHVRFAYNGEVVEKVVADRQLINYIDALDAMGLVFDGDGVVIDVVGAKDIATEVAKEFFVKKIDGNYITLNSSIAMNGMDVDVEVTDMLGIYDVTQGSENPGAQIEPAILDKVTVYANALNVGTHMYITEHAPDAGVYWRTTKKYDSKTAQTTREPDENGVYTIEFAHEGALVELKCKDISIVNEIDKANDIYGEFAFVLDDEGYIVESVDVGMALRGVRACNNYDVTAIEGNTFETLRNLAGNEKGNTYSATYDENCKIFLVENGCDAEFIGQRVDSLKLGDRITVYTDVEGNPLVIFVVNRRVDSPMYYRLDKYGTKNSITTRPKDANGYYVFDMICQGKKVQVKVKDAKVATRMEWRNPGIMGLTIENGVVTKLHPAGCVSGWSSAWNNYYVQSVSAPIVTLVNAATGNTYNRMLAEGAEIYDVSGNFGTELGSVTTLKPGDKVTGARNIADEITHLYVLQRYEESAKLHYSISRKYNTEDKVTNREPDEEGYYVFETVSGGKQYTLKTKNKKMATWIDAQSTQMVSLKTSGNIITGAYTHVTSMLYGTRPVNYNYVKSINWTDRTFMTYYYQEDVRKDSDVVRTMSKDCVVYNVSAGYVSQRGEKTTLKKDDRIQTFATEDTGEICLILVIERKVDSPLYWSASRKYNATTKETTRTPDANGWYVFDLFVNGETKQFKTKDKELASKVDSYSSAFALRLNGDVIEGAYAANVAKNVKTTAAGHYDVMAIDGNKLTLVRNRPLAGDYGKRVEIEMYKNTKTYDVSTYAEPRGAKATVGLGDRVTVYSNMEGKAEYIYINYKNTHEKGHISYCEHCGENVLWEPYSQTFYETDGHYYIPADMTSWNQKTIGYAKPEEGQEQFEIVLDLNGKELIAKKRLALIYSDMTVLDTVGGGKIVAQNQGGNLGGMIMVTGGGTLNLRSGTLTLADQPEKLSREGGLVWLGSKSAFNMYGGAIEGGKVAPQEGNTKTPFGGNVYVNNSVFNMYGGTISGGTATGGNGGNIAALGGATLNIRGGKVSGGTAISGGNIYIIGTNTKIVTNASISGGEIAGDVYIAKFVNTTLSGQPRITMGAEGGLQLAKDVTVKATGLTGNASIVIRADGIFTDGGSAKALQYFKPESEGATITAVDGELFYTKAPADYTAPLAFENGTNVAYCAVCDQKVAWTEINQATNGETAIAAPTPVTTHYYLSEDVTYTGTDAFITAGGVYSGTQKTTCLHLNGHNLTATQTRVIVGSTGIFNVLGEGVVSGNNNASNNSATVHINCQFGMGIINLYAGTYTKDAANDKGTIVHIGENGGHVNVYKDAIIDGTGRTAGSNAVCVTVTGGDPNVNKNRGDGCLDMSGGKILGGNGISVKLLTEYAYFAMGGGSIAGTAEIQNAALVALTGNPQISKLIVPEGFKLTLGQLNGASIGIVGNGVFTEELTDPQSYMPNFIPAKTGATITVEGSALCYNAPIRNINDPLDFDEGTTVAECPVCKKTVTWIAVDQATYGETGIPKAASNVVAAHYYLAEDITYTGTSAFLTALDTYESGAKQKITCFHLNGHSITGTNNKIFQGNTGIMNIMGHGTVSGNYKGTAGQWSGRNSTTLGINVTVATGTVNLYGGTYTKPADNSQPIVNIYNNGGCINLYEGATIDGTGTTGVAVDICNGVFAMEGGKIIAGDDDAIQVANYSATAKGKLVVTGGTVQGTVDVQETTAMELSGNPAIGNLAIPTGTKITVGALTEGASIGLSANGVFAENVANAAEAASYFHPISVGDTVTADGTSLVYNAKVWTVTDDLVFDPGTKNAFCAVCQQKVTWIEVNQTTNGETAIAAPTPEHNHYYLSEDVTYTGADAFITAPGVYQGRQKTTCFHLNGHDLTAANTRVLIGSTGVFSFLGNGTVSGNNNASNNSATIHQNNQFGQGIINLYAGTYTKDSANDKGTIIYIKENGGYINIYKDAIIDGTGLSAESNAVCVAVMGGDPAVNRNRGDGHLNIYGGKILGGNGTAVKVLTQYAHFNMEGGEIRGGVAVDDSKALSLSGAVKIDALSLAAGKLLTLGELTDEALIKVTANGVFTAECDKAAEYAAYFQPVNASDKVEAKGKVLVCSRDYNKDLAFEAGTKNAYCAVCDKVVTWTEVNQTTNGTAALGIPSAMTTHYYLSENVTYSGTDPFLTAPSTYQGQVKTACFHLNGHNLTTTAGRVFTGYPGVLNVMGNGTVSGGYSNASSDYYKSTGATIHMNTNQTTGQINLYGGIYTKADGIINDTLVIHDNGGTVNVYEGATVNGGATAYHGNLNVIGGTVSGGLNVKIRTAGKSPAAVLNNATVDTVSYTAGSLTLAGQSKLVLTVKEGLKIELGELVSGAAITVSATGEFTVANAKAAEYATYFTPAVATDSVVAQDNTLRYVTGG